MGKKILAIDDDPSFLELLEQIFSHEGHKVFKANRGREGLRLLFTHRPDIVLLDMVMPDMNGYQTCRLIREVSDVPIVIVTGKRKAAEDILQGLDYGADSYLIKPMGSREMVARVQAVLRRAEMTPTSTATKENTYSDGYLTLNAAERKVIVNGERVKLTPREFRLLALLVENAGRVLTHKQILEKVWGWEYVDDLDYIRIYVLHLRQKIEPNPAQPRYIVTEPGVGYSFQKAS